MAHCDSIPARLSLRLDDQLSASENASLEADLRDCPQYTLLAVTLAQLDLMFRATPLVSPDRDLTGQVMARIEQRREQRLLGLTFLAGAILSLIPTVLLALALAFGFNLATRPGSAHAFIAGLTRWLGQVYALWFTLGNIRDHVLSPWLLPALAAAVSVSLLGATVLWARRLTPAISPR